jgi:hypothetical protein
VAVVAKNMEERQEFLADIHARLEQAQSFQKLHFDKTHRVIAYKSMIGCCYDFVNAQLRRCPRPPPASSSHATMGPTASPR